MYEPELHATWRDYSWAAVSLLAAAATISAVADSDILVGAIILLAGIWIVVGAYRRTIWGCPFSHAEDALDPCPRHDESAHVRGGRADRVD
jgi:hypothetical protein